ncbi:hypothetical protein D046_3953A, partial [Vibrio parahaemolyticus V-223/04]
MSGCTIGYC